MEQYIPKSVLVAEIERLKKEEGWCQVGKDTADVYYARGFRFACERIINVLDTLEVKEVDLKQELSYEDYNNFFEEHPNLDNDWGFEETWTFGQYCYKLGIKARKGE